ncbi:MAG: hypothetical protein WAK55_34230 [Xanthobacteraceae bacterium]
MTEVPGAMVPILRPSSRGSWTGASLTVVMTVAALAAPVSGY